HQGDPMDMRTRLSTLIFMVLVLVLGLLGGVVLDRQLLLYYYPASAVRPGDENRFALLTEAWNVVQTHYVAIKDVDQKNLVYGAISGMVDALGDEGHSRFLTPKMLEQETSQIQAKFEGIGATVEFRNGNAVIVAPLDGSPAQKAGVKPGDIIL